MLRSLQAEAGAATRAIKHRLRRGEPVLAIDIGVPSPGLVELLGRLGADMAMVDCARGPIGVEALDNLARAAKLANLPLVARIPGPDAPSVDRHMARGVDGIIVPRLNTADQARQALDAVRGLLPKHHSEKLVIAQIASAQAVAELDRFLDIDGIDAYYVSPPELATSLGYEGRFRHPEMQQVIDDILAAIRASGRAPGVMVDRKSVQGYVRKGTAFLYAHLGGLVAAGLQETTALINRVAESGPAPARPAPPVPPTISDPVGFDEEPQMEIEAAKPPAPPASPPAPEPEPLPEPAVTAAEESPADALPPEGPMMDELPPLAPPEPEMETPAASTEDAEEPVSSPEPDPRYELASPPKATSQD